MNPCQYAIYKGKSAKWGAVQFALRSAYTGCSACRKPRPNYISTAPLADAGHENCQDARIETQEGVIFVDASSAIGPNQYDWKNKVSFALGVVDLGKILLFFNTAATPESKLSLVHDPGAQTESQGKVQKYFDLSSPKGIDAGCILTLSQKNAGGETKRHTIPISPDEVQVLASLFRVAIPRIQGWL